MLSMSFMQTKSALAAKEKLEKTRAEDSERLSKQTRQKEEQLAKLMQDKETKHSRLIFLLFLVVCFIFLGLLLGRLYWMHCMLS